jgi:carboxymethylenebutenolidase
MKAFDPESHETEQALARAGLSRRGIMAVGLATGFALAVRPVSATALTTGAEGLNAGPISIPAPDGAIPAYRAMPASATGPLPLIVVVHEIFGVHAYIQDVCRRLAKIGYCAVAPDLFRRQGDVTTLPDVDAIMKVVAKVPDEQVMADIDAVYLAMTADGVADPRRFGITGFCWGGRVVWLYAAHNPKLVAGVAWYGRLKGAPAPERPTQPIDVANKLVSQVLGLYGGKDQGIPVADVEEMRQKLFGAHSGSDIIVYPEAGHGFHADYRPSFDPAAAGDAWLRMQQWFRGHGV